MSRASLLLLTAVALAACGGNDSPQARQTTTAAGTPPECSLMEPGRNAAYLLCRKWNTPGDRGRFAFRGRGTIPVEYPYEGPAGHWSGGFLSPDGRVLLAQWTAECEVPYAFFVSARGGKPGVVTGEARLEDAPASIAHGWTLDGEAIVEVLPDCNRARPDMRSQIWLISPDGAKRRLRP